MRATFGRSSGSSRPDDVRCAMSRAVGRSEPPFDGDEASSLGGWLDFYRAAVVSKVEGLDEDAVRWAPVASGTNLLGILKHLAFAEDYWFGQIFAGEPERISRIFPGDVVPETETIDDVISLYERLCERSRRILAETDPGSRARGNVQNRRGHARQFNLRWIVMHMIEETARHAGHADIIREQLDGRARS